MASPAPTSTCRRDPAKLRFPAEQGRTVTVHFERGTLRATAGPAGGNATAALALQNVGTFNAQLRLPRLTQGLVLREQPLSGTIAVHVRDLSFVEGFVPDLRRLSGTFDADLGLAGTAGAPRLTGRARLEGGPRPGAALRPRPKGRPADRHRRRQHDAGGRRRGALRPRHPPGHRQSRPGAQRRDARPPEPDRPPLRGDGDARQSASWCRRTSISTIRGRWRASPARWWCRRPTSTSRSRPRTDRSSPPGTWCSSAASSRRRSGRRRRRWPFPPTCGWWCRTPPSSSTLSG